MNGIENVVEDGFGDEVVEVDPHPAGLDSFTASGDLPLELDGRVEVDVEEAMTLPRAEGREAVTAVLGKAGTGKTMLARRLATVMPPLTFEEMLEVSAAHSVLGLTSSKRPLVTVRPFRRAPGRPSLPR